MDANTQFRVLDLFSGIGGFSLGLERTGGFRTVAFCEIEPFCRRVLAKHWPKVPCYHDVRKLTAERLAADGIGVDVICGGFPCQDISLAGKGAGLEGERSGLWSEFARLIREIRPQHVIVENVAALLGRGLDRVLGDLAEIGFDAEWHCIPASAVGAPHRRDRVWLVAYANGGRQQVSAQCDRGQARPQQPASLGNDANRLRDAVADAARELFDGSGSAGERRRPQSANGSEVGLASGSRLAFGAWSSGEWAHAATAGAGWWSTEPDVGRVAHGVPSRVDRLRALGNAVVPQIPELIGRAILARAS